MITPIKNHLKKTIVVAMMVATPFVANWEGLETTAYLDAVNVKTICYGSTEGVRLGDTKTPEECERLLSEELSAFMTHVDSISTVELNPKTLAALASFSYNVGKSAFSRSTLLRKLNSGDKTGACNELSRWVYAGGRKLKGLENRRKAEKELCLEGVYDDNVHSS